MSTHAKYSPSKLPRIIRCPGSVNLTKDIEESTSSYAAEGTMLHDIMETLLRRKEYTVPDTIIKQHNLDTEQIEALQECLDYVFTLLATQTEIYYEDIEIHVSMSGFAEDHDCLELEHVAGTLDYRLSIPSQRILYIIDWKFGKGIEVFPDSEQLKTYGLASLKNYKVLTNFDEIHIIIGQPRLYSGEHFKVEVYHPEELMQWCIDSLIPALKQVDASPPIYAPSDKACQWCRAKLDMLCIARHKQNMETAQDVFRIYANIPDKVDIDELVDLWEKTKELKQYIKDIGKFMVKQLINSKPLPGYKMVYGRSVRVWANEDKAKAYLLDELDIDWDELHKSKFLGPASIEKLKEVKKFIGVGKNKDKVKDKEFRTLIHKPEGAHTMVLESDKRKAIAYETAEDKFKDFIVPKDK